jgi:hypothetical protein
MSIATVATSPNPNSAAQMVRAARLNVRTL